MPTCLLRKLPLVFLVPSLAAVAWAEQSRPNFSGTWSRIEPKLGPRESYVERIDLYDSTLKIAVDAEFSTGFGAGALNHDHTYAIGGPAETRTHPDGSRSRIVVTWDGTALVFVRTTQEGANTTTERVVWSISEDGKTLTEWRETTSWRGTERNRTVLERR